MSASLSGSTASLFEIKNGQLPLLVLVLRSTRLDDVAAQLEQRYGHSPGFFAHDAVLIDLSALKDTEENPDWGFLLPLLRRYDLVPVAVRGGSAKQMQTALRAGLAQAETLPAPPKAPEDPPAAIAPPPVLAPPVPLSAMIVDKPLRSGQRVYARGRDLVVLAMVNPGAEVIADGHVHVLAPLRGRAIAGAQGDTEARIFATCLEAELVSIAGVYRTSETPLPPNAQGKSVHIRLETGSGGEKLLIEPIA